jgi:hypothetical protein
MNGGRFSYRIARRVRSICGKHGVRRCRRRVWLKRISVSQMAWQKYILLYETGALTFELYLTFYTWLACATKSVSTDKFEVLCRIIHFLSFHVRDDDVYVVAAVLLIVHPPQKHEFGELNNVRSVYKNKDTKRAHHREHHGHHRELSILHRTVVINMGGPGPIEWYQASRIHRPTKNVLGDKLALVPDEHLAALSVRCMLSLPYAAKPIPVRVIAMFKPLVNQAIGAFVVKGLAHQLAH